MLPGQQRNIVPPACPGSPQGPRVPSPQPREDNLGGLCQSTDIYSHSMPFVSTNGGLLYLSKGH